MKKSKIIIPALAMLVMSTAATVTGTVAWFSANKNVYAEGMKVKAQAEGSLVITEGSHLPTTSDHGSRQIWEETNPNPLYPSTHINTSGRSAETSSSGLVRVTNGEYVNPETGSYNGIGATGVTGLTYAAATSTDFFKDYVVYIAGDGNQFTDQDLVITISGAITNEGTTTINKAISIDFYANLSDTTTWEAATNPLINESYYMGALNLANYKNGSDDMSREAKGEIRYAGAAGTGITIPATGSAQCLAVTMRVYFDGNLIEIAPGSETQGKTAATAYDTIADGTASSTITAPYVYKNGSYVATTDAPATLNGYSFVNSSKSTYRYARTVKSADMREVLLSVDFSASPHPQNNG